MVEPAAVDDAQADDGKHDGEGAFVEAHFGTDLVGPNGGHFADGEAISLERIEEIDVEGDVGDAQGGVNFLHGLAPHDLGAALRVFDAHAEEKFHEHVKDAAEDAAFHGLGLLQNGAGNPTRTDGAIDFLAVANEVQEGGRGSRSVGVHVTNQIGLGPEAEAFDEGAAFADGGLEFEPADNGKVGSGGFNDAEGVVAATVEHDHDLEFGGVVGAKIGGVFAQDGPDPLLFIVSRD